MASLWKRLEGEIGYAEKSEFWRLVSLLTDAKKALSYGWHHESCPQEPGRYYYGKIAEPCDCGYEELFNGNNP